MRLSTTLTPQMARLIDVVKDRFAADYAAGLIRGPGVYNCRPKNNVPGAAYSEHSWGNAGDFYIDPDGGIAGDRLASWAKTSPLVAEVFWKVPLHYDHVHLTASPRRNYDNQQIPPCAGGNQEDNDMALFPLKAGDGYTSKPSFADQFRPEKAEDVEWLQAMLNTAFAANLELDGKYGKGTIDAVSAYLGGNGKYVGGARGRKLMVAVARAATD